MWECPICGVNLAYSQPWVPSCPPDTCPLRQPYEPEVTSKPEGNSS